jgi:hypothetical protein
MKSNLIEPLNDRQIAGDKKEDRAYLQAVAPTAQLGSFPPKRDQRAASPVSSIYLITEQAGTTAQTLQELYGRRYDGYYHWGLNE